MSLFVGGLDTSASSDRCIRRNLCFDCMLNSRCIRCSLIGFSAGDVAVVVVVVENGEKYGDLKGQY